jgi:hypothetical protein
MSSAMDKAKRALKPEQEKDLGDKAKDYADKAENKLDKGKRAAKPESEKSLKDKAKDKMDQVKNSSQN